MSKSWNDVADEQFSNMPDNFQDDWSGLRKRVQRRFF